MLEALDLVVKVAGISRVSGSKVGEHPFHKEGIIALQIFVDCLEVFVFAKADPAHAGVDGQVDLQLQAFLAEDLFRFLEPVQAGHRQRNVVDGSQGGFFSRLQAQDQDWLDDLSPA